MRKRMHVAQKAGKTACSVVLAAGLCYPCGLALADGVESASAASASASAASVSAAAAEVASAGASEASSSAAAPVVAEQPAAPADAATETEAPVVAEEPEAVEDDANVDTDKADDPQASEEPKKDEGAVSEERAYVAPEHAAYLSKTDEILEAARAIQLKGIDALERYLAHEKLTAEEILSIDVEALRGIDAELADEIAALQEKARADIEAAEADKAKEGEDPEASKAEEKADELKAAEAGEKAPKAEENPYPAWSYSGNTAFTPHSYGVNLSTTKFIAVVGEPARQLAADHDLYASVMIAQAILESGSGSSGLAQPPYHNLFGIKGSFQGESVTMSTQEDDGTGAYYTISSAFKSYPSYSDSLNDYADLLSRAMYLPAHKSTTNSFVDACNYLEGTYATSTEYSEALQGLIVAYDLTRYDDPLAYEFVNESKASNDDDASVVDQASVVKLVTAATDNLGCAYVWGAAGPDTYDCSGLVVSSYESALGMKLPRTTHYQCLQGSDVDFNDLHMGDLVFFVDGKNIVYHVGMYLGEGCYIEAMPNDGVRVTAMGEQMPTFAKRVLPTQFKDEATIE